MLLNNISKFLSLPEIDIEDIVEVASTTYKMYEIPKKNGAKRKIFQPSAKTKALQYAIMECFLSKFIIHPAAMAYVNGLESPLRKNALEHCNNNYQIRIDFKDFFPSLGPNDFFNSENENNPNNKNVKDLSKEEKVFLTKSLFLFHKEKYELAIGAPASPIISNIIMYNIDNEISSFLQDISSTGKYTRYSDDIIFSCKEKSSCEKFFLRILKLVENTTSPKLSINKEKTIYSSRKNCRKVTGLIITPDKKISIGRKRKRYIKSLIHKYLKGLIDIEKGLPVIKGYLAFIKDVEPEYLHNLSMKYGAKVIDDIFNS